MFLQWGFHFTHETIRNWEERLIKRLKQFRRLTTRYEKRAENYRRIGYMVYPDEPCSQYGITCL